ncbi:hypothetical protein C0989_003886 [Termitomyces sp. Mn162]|nr:hypothetical protein C0989_003886 [Termitomyces sp. Mn162]
MVNTSLAAAEEPFSGSPQPSSAPTEAEPSLSTIVTSPSPSATPVMSSKDATIEESIKLNYINELSTLTTASPETSDLIILGSSDAAVATNITTSIAPEARTSGSSDMTNNVSECWADIMSNEEVLSLQMDKKAG